ncbi:MAG: trigger factor [Acidobacteriia bacterium]|nr:trigger factor [Terriglobia bacterium]
MKSVLIEKEGCKRELEIEIPPEDWKKQADEVAQEFAKMAHVPGFRPGHVPVAVVKQRFRQEIRSELLKKVIPEVIEQAASEQKVSMITQPQINGLILEDEKPLTFKAEFEVLPTIEISDYKGLRAEEEPISVGEGEVEKRLADLQEQAAEFIVISDRPIRTGDFAVLSFTAYPTRKTDEKPEKAFEAKDLLVEVDGKQTLKEFSENLLGKSTGEEAHFKVEYPDDFSDRRLAGRRVSYQVKIEAIKTKSLPQIDDDLAKTLGEFDTLIGLKDKIRKDIEEGKRQIARSHTLEALVNQIIEKNPFPVPSALVEAQIDSRLQGMIRSMYQQGIDPRQLSIEWEKIREENRDPSLRDVKVTFILDHIAKKENISVSDDELDVEVTKIAERTQEPFSSVKQHLTKDGTLDKLRSQLTNRKTLNFLYENADIVRGPAQLDKPDASS